MLQVRGGDSVTIRRLRAHVAGNRHAAMARRRAAQVRLRLAYRMQSVALCPPGMPPSGILVVRRVVTAPTERVATATHAVRTRSGKTWERAARDELAVAFRRAARPLAGPPTAVVEAVYFGDEAELLACFAMDLAIGRAGACWWWRSLWADLSATGTIGLFGLLRQQVRVLPAVLQRLVEARAAGKVLGLFSAVEALALVEALARAYELPDAGRMARFDGPRAAPTHGPRRAQAAAATHSAPRAAADPYSRGAPSSGEVSKVHPPWHNLALPSLPSPAHEYLLGLALAVYISPSMPRDLGFRRDLHAWWVAAQHFRPAAGAGEELLAASVAADAPPPAAAPVAQADQACDPNADEAQESPRRKARTGSAVEARRGGRPSPASATSPADAEPPAASTERFAAAQAVPEVQPVGKALAGGGSDVHAAAARAAPRIPDQTARAAAEETPAALPPWRLQLEGGVETGLAGTFYLVNVMCRLGLPACFEHVWHLGRDLGAWGVLELLARGLLARHGPPDVAGTDDPIWVALAALAGRASGSLPARPGRSGPLYRTPRAWLSGLDSASDFFYSSRGGRLCVWSRDGLVIAECARGDVPPSVQARAELRRAGSASSVRLWRVPHHSAPLATMECTWTAGLQPVLVRWLACVMPAVEQVLRTGLGMDEAGALWALLAVPGRLYVTTAHVDVVMGLEDISLSARLTGLDRDPGWLPEFGRVILFHFDE